VVRKATEISALCVNCTFLAWREGLLNGWNVPSERRRPPGGASRNQRPSRAKQPKRPAAGRVTSRKMTADELGALRSTGPKRSGADWREIDRR
jgi:hypothetical protein